MDIRRYEPLFGAWHVVRQIGAGSFGTVYEIARTEYGQTYRSALKVISIPSSRAEARAILEDVVRDLIQFRQHYMEASSPTPSASPHWRRNKPGQIARSNTGTLEQVRGAAIQAPPKQNPSAVSKKGQGNVLKNLVWRSVVLCFALCALLAILVGVVELGRSLAVFLQSGTEQVAQMTERAQTWREAYEQAAQIGETDPACAMELLDVAIEADPSRSEAYILRGDTWLALGETAEHYQAALEDYKTAADLAPTEARLSKNLAANFCDRAAGNVCKGLRPLKVNCPKGKRSWPGPCAFNQHVFLNFS